MVEIQCHGGVQPLQKILQLTLLPVRVRRRPASLRSVRFLNGRIDLTQAEAVMDIIRSRSEASLKLAARQQQGQLAGELRSLRKQLVDIVVNLEAVIDYPEEDIEDVTYGRVQESLSTVCSGIEHLLAHAHTGKILREGLRTAIVGRPNVGKSSLLNALLRESVLLFRSMPVLRVMLLRSSCCLTVCRWCWLIRRVSVLPMILWRKLAWRRAVSCWRIRSWLSA